MKSILFAALALCAATSSFANDSGISAIKVNDIKMREYKFNAKTYKDDEVKRYANPNFKISFSGGNAANLKKILPVMQAADGGQTSQYISTLGIYSDATKGVTSKIVTISCQDGAFTENGWKKLDKTECQIEIVAADQDGNSIEAILGDVSEFEPKVCK